MQTQNRSRCANLGFSLLEVLVAVVIMSFGLLALAALQGSLFKASAEAKAQSAGLALASEKIEYFRGYKDIATYQAIDSVASDPLNPIDIGGTSYSRSWTVARYAYPAAGGSFVSVSNVGSLSNTYAPNNEFKRVVVKVKWKDSQGVDQEVALEDAIAGIDPGDSRKIGKLISGVTPRGPEVKIFDPTTQQEGVIPIAIGGDATCVSGSCAAATNPKPLVNGGNVTETRFDVTTYAGANGTTATAQSRVETSIVGCTCKYETTTSTTIRGMRPTYWNGYRYVLPETAAYNPPAAVDPSAVGESALCTICCRDHHDPSSVAAGEARFDPRNTGTGGHAGGHFLMNATTGTIGSQVSSGSYTESCRVIRVGGLFRVASDMYDDYMNTLDTNSLVASPDVGKSLYVPTAAATTNYQNFVKGYLQARNVTPTTGLNNPPTVATTLEDLIRPRTVAIKKADLTHASEVKWLHLRGLYVDYLEDSAIQAVQDAKTNCVGTGGAAPSADQLQVCVLKVLPFTTINLTELGNWTPARSGDTGYDQIAVAGNNASFPTTLTSVEPIRGKVTVAGAATVGSKPVAEAKLRRSNSGLATLLGGIDTEDRLATEPLGPQATSTATTLSAKQEFEIADWGNSSGGGGSTVDFLVNLPGYAYLPANITRQYIKLSDGTTCNATTGIGDPWSCRAAAAGPIDLDVGNYNYAILKDTAGMTLTCSGMPSGTTHLFTDTNGQGAQKVNECHNFAVTAITPVPSDGVMSEHSVTSQTISGGATINIGMTEQPTTYSYTCVFAGNSGQASMDNKYDVAAVPCPP